MLIVHAYERAGVKSWQIIFFVRFQRQLVWIIYLLFERLSKKVAIIRGSFESRRELAQSILVQDDDINRTPIRVCFESCSLKIDHRIERSFTIISIIKNMLMSLYDRMFFFSEMSTVCSTRFDRNVQLANKKREHTIYFKYNKKNSPKTVNKWK